MEMQNAATIMSDHEEAIENTEGHGWNGEKIHGGDRFPMVVQERFPLSASIRFLRSTLHPVVSENSIALKTRGLWCRVSGTLCHR